MTPYDVLRDRVSRSPATPLVTYVDPSTGERMELSAVSLDNAIAKTAGLLRDDLDAQPQDHIGIRLPWHWQRAVWFGACAATSTIFDPEIAASDAAVCVLDRAHLDLAGTAPDDVLVSLAAFGLPDGEPVPGGVIEAAVAMRAHPDQFRPFSPPRGDEVLLVAGDTRLTGDLVMEEAARLAHARDLAPGARFAVLPDDPERDLLMLAVPLVIGGSVILVRDVAPHLGQILDHEGAVLTR
jgi:uncharacterized protein (TIGR03089 family)